MSSSIKEQMHNRNQGLAYALRLVHEGGIKALEDKINFYNITGISMLPGHKEGEYVLFKLSEHATEVAIAFALTTLMDEFNFGSYQLQKFKKAFDGKVFEILSSGNVDQAMADQADRITRETGSEIIPNQFKNEVIMPQA